MEKITARALATPLGIRECLSLLESAVIVNVSEDRLRKDIENKRIFPKRDCCGYAFPKDRIYFAWAELFPLAVMYNDEGMPADWRKTIWTKWSDLCDNLLWDNEPVLCTTMFDISHIVPKDMTVNLKRYVNIDFSEACKDIAPRINTYARGLARIEEREDTLNGAPVFSGTRISVINVGHMVEDGETLENLLEDFPMLSKDDVEFAHLYFLAHPPIGRPAKRMGLIRDENSKPANR